MKSLSNLTRVSAYLTKVNRAISETFFDGELENIVITVQSSETSYGHCSLGKPWSVKNPDGTITTMREINISSTFIAARRPEATIATLVHEDIHAWNADHGISDCSNRFRYHNHHFRDKALSLQSSDGRYKEPIHLDYDKSIGWSITSANDSLIEWMCDNDFDSEILIGRLPELTFIGGFGTTAPTTTPTTPKVKPKGSNSRLLECPSCHMKLRATKDGLRVMCMDCGEQLEYKS